MLEITLKISDLPNILLGNIVFKSIFKKHFMIVIFHDANSIKENINSYKVFYDQ